LRVSVKRIAAVTAFAVALVYFLMSGGNVATERAFVMVGVALVAVMLDKRALSLRAVAVAATIVLLRRPETLLSPGFQMSFAATTALVAVFGWIRDHDVPLGPRWFRPALAVLISSAVAGAATAPIGAIHFNTLAHYGLLANLTCVPVMGVLVMPMAVLAALHWPLRQDWIRFAGMQIGLEWILWVAGQVAGLDGAQGQVVMPEPMVLPFLAIGALILMLWQGRARLFGVFPMLLALVLWQQTTRPIVLVADSGGLVGVMTEKGRALSKPKGMGFAARIWLENDGDNSDQTQAAARWEQAGPTLKIMNSAIGRVVHVTGKKYRTEPFACNPSDIVIAPFAIQTKGACQVYDGPVLSRTGSLALTGEDIRSASDTSGARIWSGKTQ
jgi:competence protein ComEC